MPTLCKFNSVSFGPTDNGVQVNLNFTLEGPSVMDHLEQIKQRKKRGEAWTWGDLPLPWPSIIKSCDALRK